MYASHFSHSSSAQGTLKVTPRAHIRVNHDACFGPCQNARSAPALAAAAAAASPRAPAKATTSGCTLHLLRSSQST